MASMSLHGAMPLIEMSQNCIACFCPCAMVQGVAAYLCAEAVSDGFNVIAHLGTAVQELHVTTTISQAKMDAALRKIA